MMSPFDMWRALCDWSAHCRSISDEYRGMQATPKTINAIINKSAAALSDAGIDRHWRATFASSKDDPGHWHVGLDSVSKDAHAYRMLVRRQGLDTLIPKSFRMNSDEVKWWSKL